MAKPPSRRRSRVDERQARETRNAVIKIAGVAAVVLAVGWVYFSVISQRQRLDPETLCPAKPNSVTVLLVDVTDPMTPAQRQDFNNQLEGLKNSIPRYGKLIVTKVDATGEKLLVPVIVKCNPGSAADESDATGNPEAAQRRWEEGFNKPLTATFDGLATATGADQSPVLESVQSVALTELQKPAMRDKKKRLIVISDLLQNTPEVSFYGELPDPDAFLKSKAFQKARTDLRDVEIELWMLQRTDAATTQPKALADLWDAILAKQGGNVKRVYNVSG